MFYDKQWDNAYSGWSYGFAATGNQDDYFLMFDTASTNGAYETVYTLALPSLKAGQSYDLLWKYAALNTVGGTSDLVFDIVDEYGALWNPAWTMSTGSMEWPRFEHFSSINWKDGAFTLIPASNISNAFFRVKSRSLGGHGALNTYGSDFVLDDISIKGDCHPIPPKLPQTPQAVPATSSISILLTMSGLLGLAIARRKKVR